MKKKELKLNMMMVKLTRVTILVNPLTSSVTYHTETRANQLTGFCMMGNTGR